MKKCTKCGIIKDLFDFTRDKYTKSGFGSWCKECCRKSRREHITENPKQVHDSQKKWRTNNPDKAHETINKWYSAHPEYSLEWHKRNPSKRSEYYRNYCSKKRGDGGKITSKEWEELCRKYGNKCLCCGRRDVKLTLDHVIPIKLGGKNIVENAQPLCKSCNSKKNAKHIDYRPF